MSEGRIRSSAIWLGSFYLVALIAATPLAYAGTLWLDASDRGWRTQVAAGALIAGWLALFVGAVSVWRAVKVRQRSKLLLGVACGLVAIATYSVALMWGGRMLI